MQKMLTKSEILRQKAQFDYLVQLPPYDGSRVPSSISFNRGFFKRDVHQGKNS